MIAIIVIAALALRLHGIGFGLPALNDPDELMFELGAIRMLKGLTLNPGWFGHPATTTMYLLAIVNLLVFAAGWVAGWFPTPGHFAEAIYADPSWMILPGRIAMALFGAACVYLTYRLGRRLFGTTEGLVAAALLAASPVHVAWSQVIRSDVMATAFLLLCMLAATRIARDGRPRDHVLAALWLGLAIATKWPFAVGALAIVGASLLRIADCREAPGRALRSMLACLGLSGAFVLAVSPYLLLDYPTLLRNLQGEAQARHLGATGAGAFGNAWWYVSGPLLHGLGAPGLVSAAAGVWLLRRHRTALAIIAPVALGFFVLICAQKLVWERWALPLLPLLALLAGLAAMRLFRAAKARLPSDRPSRLLVPLGAAGLLALCVPPLVEVRANAAARLNDTRQQASWWIRAHVPPGSTIIVEHFGFDLLTQPVGLLFPIGEAGCVDVRPLLRGQVSYAPIEAARGGRSNIDYGTLPPGKRRGCRADYAILTHYDRYRNERAQFPGEYASYRELIGRGEIVASFSPEPGVAGGPVVRIVRIARPPR